MQQVYGCAAYRGLGFGSMMQDMPAAAGAPVLTVDTPVKPDSAVSAPSQGITHRAMQAAEAGRPDEAARLNAEAATLRGLERAAAAAGEHGDVGRANAIARQAAVRGEAVAKGAKGGMFGRGIPWEGKTGGEKAAVVTAGAGTAGGAAWMLGLL